MKMVEHRNTSGLLWTALIIALAGYGIRYVLLLDRTNPQTSWYVSVTLVITLIGAGICLISAMSSWWVKR